MNSFQDKKLHLVVLIIVSCILPAYQCAMEQPRHSHFIGDYVQVDEDLYYAIIHGNVDEVRQALVSGADPNRIERTGFRMLHLVALSTRDEAVEIMRLLLDYNADPEALTLWEGDTPLDLVSGDLKALSAKSQEDLEHDVYQMEALLKIAIAKKREREKRERLKEKGKLELAESVITATSEKMSQQKCQMGRALSNSRIERVQVLLDQGINPEMVIIATGEIPGLFLAAIIDDPGEAEAMVQFLIPHINNLNPTFKGQRLLDVLRRMPDRQSVVALIERAIRDREQIPPIAPEVPWLIWIGRLLGLGLKD